MDCVEVFKLTDFALATGMYGDRIGDCLGLCPC